MAAIDIFCSADDRHRVILLVNLLERAGQNVTLRCEPVATPTEPCILACTRRALREPWINSLFQEASTMVAIRLDDTPLPAPCARIIDMQTWPARSADRKVGSLVRWLQHRGPGSALSAIGDEAVHVAAGTPGRRWGGIRTRATDRLSNTMTNLGALALLAMGGYLVSLAMPGDQDSPGAAATEPEVTVLPSTRQPTIGSVPTGAGTAEPGPGAAPGDIAVAQPVTEPDTIAGPRGHLDTLTHLCLAQTPDSARAWAAALDWKQRRRLPEEPCVTELLQRLGLRSVAQLL